MEADLVEVNLLAGHRVRAQAREELDRHRVGGATQLVGNTLMERVPGGIVVAHGKALGCEKAGVAGGALAKHIRLARIEGFIEDERGIAVWEATVICCAVTQLLKSVVPEIGTLRCVGVGSG
jgi:hypothetical protein